MSRNGPEFETGRAGVRVPPIGQRERIPAEAIDDVVRQIAERFDPERIVLFGSYATGEARPDSDVDVLVVMDTPLRETEQAVRICQALDYHFGLDLIVKTPATLERRLALGDQFLRDVIAGGKIVHKRAHG